MWKIAGASIIGSSHIKNLSPCQDFIHSLTRNEVSCISLADGAGSYKYSDIGAEISCKAITEYFTSEFDRFLSMSALEIKQFIIHGIRTRLGRKARVLDTTKVELSSTLLFVAIKGHNFIIGHIGDGVICGDIDGNLVLLSNPENGEFANTTYFVTSRNYKEHFRIYRGNVTAFKSFFLMSDGAAEALFHKKEHIFSPALKIFASWLDKHHSEDVDKAIKNNMEKLFPKHTSDDCSIIIAHKITKYSSE
ncbi:MAG: protein phosphatase 2C domain-containing protein [Ruminococcus sp.]|nr:protein phosphatase 2C domain-containing protein [Ruminococcus sp.]